MSYLHVFGITAGDGQQPSSSLIQASDGNYYGVTFSGGGNRCGDGTNACGTLYRMTPAGTVTVVHAFGSGASDGFTPGEQLLQGADGAIYGTTRLGGAHGRGTVFRITLNGDYRIVHNFGETLEQGRTPYGRLTQGRDGNFYGTTIAGGVHSCPNNGGDCGTFYRLTPQGDHKVIYSFGATADDATSPDGGLIEEADGSFIGTSISGGNNSCELFISSVPPIFGCGTVYRITAAGAISIIHRFGATPEDGRRPGPLVRGDDGNFYGLTRGGGVGRCVTDEAGCGTVFRLTPSGEVTTLYTFARERFDGISPMEDGYNPTGFLAKGLDGNFYGMTESGGFTGTTRTGTIFRITTSGTKTILFKFGPAQTRPMFPTGGLLLGSDGAFYGVTVWNEGFGAVENRFGSGTIFRMAPR